jgi:hypothetical protein
VTASTTTTIRGVSIFSRQRKRKADVFDIALSSEGIVIRRPGRSDQHMRWERVTQWEIAERPDCIVLTLRGGGSVTPLMVKGWTLENLEAVMRDVTEANSGPVDSAAAPAPAAVGEQAPPAVGAADVPDADVDADATDPEAGPGAVTRSKPRAARRQAKRRPRRDVWKPLVTIVLLGVLATAVALVLLQSAGVISWSFLGPVA